MKSSFYLLILFLFPYISLNAQSWGKVGSGANGLNKSGAGVYTMCIDPSMNLYIAGWIDDSEDRMIVEKWDGTTWSKVGAGSSILSTFMDITSICSGPSGNIYVSGEYLDSPSAVVAKWDGTNWTKLVIDDYVIHSDVSGLCSDKLGNIYAGVSVPYPGYSYVAKWDGSTWTKLGALNANNAINTIFVDTSGNIYAAGHFTDSSFYTGGNLYVAKWDGTTWTELGASGITHQIGSGNLEIFTITGDTAGNIYAAGHITESGIPEYVAKWDGSTWSRVESPTSLFNGNIAPASMCLDVHGNLYAAGFFGSSVNNYVAMWDGSTWSELGGTGALGADNAIMAICSDLSGTIYATGLFKDTSTLIVRWATVPMEHPFYVAKYGNIPTSLASIKNDTKILVFPNPAGDVINISGLQNPATYKLLNIVGPVMQEGTVDNVRNMVNLKNLVKGVYILEIVDPSTGLRTTNKIIKE